MYLYLYRYIGILLLYAVCAFCYSLFFHTQNTERKDLQKSKENDFNRFRAIYCKFTVWITIFVNILYLFPYFLKKFDFN